MQDLTTGSITKHLLKTMSFMLVTMASALRATGNFKPTMLVGTATVLLNMVLAPFLIFGWGTGRPLGVAGAALSTLIAVLVGSVWLAAYFLPKSAYLHFRLPDWKPQLAARRRRPASALACA